MGKHFTKAIAAYTYEYESVCMNEFFSIEKETLRADRVRVHCSLFNDFKWIPLFVRQSKEIKRIIAEIVLLLPLFFSGENGEET